MLCKVLARFVDVKRPALLAAVVATASLTPVAIKFSLICAVLRPCAFSCVASSAIIKASSERCSVSRLLPAVILCVCPVLPVPYTPLGLAAAMLKATISADLPWNTPAAAVSATIEFTPVALSVAAICASDSPAAFKLAASAAKNTASSRPF